MFIYLNQNPSDKDTTDCVIRGIMITNNSVSAEEFEKLQKDLAQLRVEFKDFIK